MKFLLESIRKNRRRLRIEELILLALRCLAILLLALPALVLLLEPDTCGEPEEDCRVRVTAQAQPSYVALEMEQAPEV